MSNPIEIELSSVQFCPLCGGSRILPFDSSPDTLLVEINRFLPPEYAKFTPNHQNHRQRCFSCGLIFLSPRPSPESLSLIYSYWHGFAYQRIMTDPDHIAERRKEFLNYHLKMLEIHCSSRGRLLDVGCGTGLFLGVAQRKGWKVTGIDFDPVTTQWARDHEEIDDMRCGKLADVLHEGETYDVITMFDYLEHSDQPGDDLDRVISHLVSGGVLMLRVPNSDGWQAQAMGSSWLGIMPTHLNYFSKTLLRNMLTQRDLAVLYLNAPNFRGEIDICKEKTAWLLKRLRLNSSARPSALKSWVNPSVASPTSALQRWIHSIAVEQLDHIGGWFGSGNNLTVIARKPR